MLVHFIGGPAHGDTRALQNPHDTYRVAEIKAHSFYPVGEELGPFAEVPYEEHEYRITRRTSRYCIAEWQAPKVTVKVAVEFTGLEFWDRDLHDELMKFAEAEQGGETGTRLIQLRRYDWGTGALTFEWSVVVDGPADAVAVSEATELVQQRLDANINRALTQRVVQRVSAAVAN